MIPDPSAYKARVAAEQVQRQANAAADGAQQMREDRKEMENDARHDAPRLAPLPFGWYLVLAFVLGLGIAGLAWGLSLIVKALGGVSP